MTPPSSLTITTLDDRGVSPSTRGQVPFGYRMFTNTVRWSGVVMTPVTSQPFGLRVVSLPVSSQRTIWPRRVHRRPPRAVHRGRAGRVSSSQRDINER